MQYYTTIDQTHHGGYPISIIIDSAILRNVEGLWIFLVVLFDKSGFLRPYNFLFLFQFLPSSIILVYPFKCATDFCGIWIEMCGMHFMQKCLLGMLNSLLIYQSSPNTYTKKLLITTPLWWLDYFRIRIFERYYSNSLTVRSFGPCYFYHWKITDGIWQPIERKWRDHQKASSGFIPDSGKSMLVISRSWFAEDRRDRNKLKRDKILIF